MLVAFVWANKNELVLAIRRRVRGCRQLLDFDRKADLDERIQLAFPICSFDSGSEDQHIGFTKPVKDRLRLDGIHPDMRRAAS